MAANGGGDIIRESNDVYNYEEETSKAKDAAGGAEPGNPWRSFRRAQRNFVAAVLLLLLGAALATASFIVWKPQFQRATGSDIIDAAFDAFVHKYSKVYATAEEREVRRAIFGASYAIIQASNARGNPYTLTVNEFSDLTSEEFRASHFGFSGARTLSSQWAGLPRLSGLLPNSTEEAQNSSVGNATDPSVPPEAVDWVAKGAVTAPKQQGGCGSCWSFSTIGSLEGAWQIASGRLLSLSEQQLIDCSRGNYGCGGGVMDAAYTDMKGKAICSEEAYPYKARAGTCNESYVSSCEGTGLPRGALVGYKDVQENDEDALLEAVARQPVSVAIEADQVALQLYGGGVLTKECGSKVDHAVLIVGYGSDAGLKYWKVKNSWGGNWGENGYVRIERGLKGAGECGINSMASYPVVEAKSELVAKAFVV